MGSLIPISLVGRRALLEIKHAVEAVAAEHGAKLEVQALWLVYNAVHPVLHSFAIIMT